MMVIYEPRGKAREYSPLAVNLYNGCGHKCVYCYVPNTIKIKRNIFDKEAIPKNDIINKLIKDAKCLFGSEKQVLMSFTTDPYNPINDKLMLTRQALQIFLKYKIKVAILTKAGTKALQDIDLIKQFGNNIKVGASLTYDNELQSKQFEKDAAIPFDRIQMLKQFNENGIKTWISFEPIMQIEQTINLLNQTINFVDEYQLGKLSGDKRIIDWNKHMQLIVNILRSAGKRFYIKETLRQEIKNVTLLPNEIDMNYCTL